MTEIKTLTDRFYSFIKNWWVKLLIGILLVIMGVVVFLHPGSSYAALAIVFGLTILLSGIAQMYIAVNTPREYGRGWLIAIAVIEILIGIMLTFNIVASAVILPFFLGFWLLFRGVSLIGIASDMKHAGIEGTGWTIFLSILLMISAIVVLVFPAIGVGAIVIWLGLSFLFAGATMIIFSLSLLRLKKRFAI